MKLARLLYSLALPTIILAAGRSIFVAEYVENPVLPETDGVRLLWDIDGQGMVADCDYHCRECGDNKHDIVVHHSQNNSKSSHLETCNVGSCSSHSCGDDDDGGEQFPIGALWDAIRSADVTGIELLIAANPDALDFNAERAAVQFRCTEGRLVASLPLREDQIPNTE